MNRLSAAPLLLSIALLVPACGGSGDSSDKLAERVEELEAQLGVDNGTPTRVDEVVGSSTTIDELRPELVRERFESLLSASVEKATEVAQSDDGHIDAYDTSICEEMTAALDSHLAAFGWDDTANRDLKPVRDQVCNDVATDFRITPGYSYDIERTDSIISPFVATATIPMSTTNSWTGSSGRAIVEPIVGSVNVTLHWAYQDGEWVLKEVESDLADTRNHAVLLLFRDGIPPSESGAQEPSPPSQATIRDELCFIADESDSGGEFIATTFGGAGESLEGAALDEWYASTSEALAHLQQTDSCPTETARQVIRESIPFTTEAEG